VHALVRGIESLLPRPFARGRALKGDQAPDPTGTLSPIRASLLVEGCVSRPPLRPGPNPRGHGRGHSGLFPYGGVCATAPNETLGRIPEVPTAGARRAVPADTLGPVRDYL